MRKLLSVKEFLHLFHKSAVIVTPLRRALEGVPEHAQLLYTKELAVRFIIGLIRATGKGEVLLVHHGEVLSYASNESEK